MIKLAEINQDLYQDTAEKVGDYLKDNHDLQLGQFEAEAFLDEILKAVTPAIYNRAIDDAINAARTVSDRLEEELDIKKVM